MAGPKRAPQGPTSDEIKLRLPKKELKLGLLIIYRELKYLLSSQYQFL